MESEFENKQEKLSMWNIVKDFFSNVKNRIMPSKMVALPEPKEGKIVANEEIVDMNIEENKTIKTISRSSKQIEVNKGIVDKILKRVDIHEIPRSAFKDINVAKLVAAHHSNIKHMPEDMMKLEEVKEVRSKYTELKNLAEGALLREEIKGNQFDEALDRAVTKAVLNDITNYTKEEFLEVFGEKIVKEPYFAQVVLKSGRTSLDVFPEEVKNNKEVAVLALAKDINNWDLLSNEVKGNQEVLRAYELKEYIETVKNEAIEGYTAEEYSYNKAKNANKEKLFKDSIKVSKERLESIDKLEEGEKTEDKLQRDGEER